MKLVTLLFGVSLTAMGCGELFSSTKEDADPGECHPSKDQCGWFNGCNDVDGTEYSCESKSDGCGGTSKRCVAKKKAVQDDLAPFPPPPQPDPPWAPNPPRDPPTHPGDPGPASSGTVTYQKIE